MYPVIDHIPAHVCTTHPSNASQSWRQWRPGIIMYAIGGRLLRFDKKIEVLASLARAANGSQTRRGIRENSRRRCHMQLTRRAIFCLQNQCNSLNACMNVQVES